MTATTLTGSNPVEVILTDANSPLSLGDATHFGTVNPGQASSGAGLTGVYSDTTGVTLDIVNGSSGVTGAEGATVANGGGAGGIGVDLKGAGATVSNIGLIYGGESVSSGNGGVALYMLSGQLTNTNKISGGQVFGGTGTGGTGAILNGFSSDTSINNGVISGGKGTANGGTGNGGIGVVLENGANLTNNQQIAGNYGAALGGVGAEVYSGASLTNTHIIAGGNATGAAGVGGAGLIESSDTDAKTIVTSTYKIGGGGGAFGGTAVELGANSSLTSSGHGIYGGAGTLGGGVGVYINGGSLTTSAFVLGGYDTTTQVRNSAVDFGPAHGTMTANAGTFLFGDIAGFQHGDSIDLTDMAPGSYTFDKTTDTLTTPDDGTIQFSGATGETFVFNPDSGSGTIITIACYCRGTRILTERGEVPIETFRVGDQVMTLSGLRPIRWIGHRSYSDQTVLGNRDLLPIRIRAGALADELPARDLWVSPEHAMYIDGILVAARDLVNGVSIVQEEAFEDLTYFHLEFDSHTVIFAEGTPSESFVDDESRVQFDNVADYWRLYPDAVDVPARFCAPRVEEGAELESVRQQLSRRAATTLTACEHVFDQLGGKSSGARFDTMSS